MKLIALLSWFDEQPAHLAELVASLHGVGVDHLVAVDGAYALYPQARGGSPSEQAAVIAATANALGVGVTLHVPTVPWAGNECEKRSVLFDLAHMVAVPGEDWLLVVDADEIVDTTGTFNDAFAEAEEDVVEVLLVQGDDVSPARRLFRAQEGGIRVQGTHSTYVDASGRLLWAPVGELEPAGRWHDFRVRHRLRARTFTRASRQQQYYTLRDAVGAERPRVHAS